MKKFWNFIQNEDTSETELLFNGPISEDTWWGDEVTPALFRDELSKVSGNLTVWLNSPGGDVFAASQIYSMLKNHKGKVTVKIDGIAASAASVVAMAGDETLIAPTALMMIHDPSTCAMGNKAENTISQKDAEKMAKKLEENRFDMDDLLEQLRQIQKMGSLKSIIGMLPGVGSKLKDADIDDRQFVRIEAMITSMTRAERAKPSIINPSRKRRIAAGSGTKVEDVNRLLKQFDQMQKMMKQLGGKAGKGGKMNRRAMKRLANMNPEQLQSLQGGIPGVPPGLMPPKK